MTSSMRTPDDDGDDDGDDGGGGGGGVGGGSGNSTRPSSGSGSGGNEARTAHRALHPQQTLAIDARSLLRITQRRRHQRRHEVHPRLAREHHAVLQRLRRLQAVGVHVGVVHVETDEVAQAVRHEHAVQVEGERARRAARDDAC